VIHQQFTRSQPVDKPREATLKSTGEKIIVIRPQDRTGTRYVCVLPPQQAWHRPRCQDIRAERLQLDKAS